MADIDETSAVPRRPSVFLSYASEDREAARMLRDALVTCGLDVWYDESELGGGEAWDQKIRRQIRECNYFMPLISARTEARIEGYFRREWRLASERTLDMADDHLFVLPIVLDETNTGSARVPEKFQGVQWLKVPGGRPNAPLEALCRRLTAGSAAASAAGLARPLGARQVPPALIATPPWIAAFPRREPDEKTGYWLRVILWSLHSIWSVLQRWPKWIRWAAYGWALWFFFSNVHIFGSHNRNADKAAIASRAAVADSGNAVAAGALLLIPFSTPEGDAAAEEFSEVAFSKVFAQLLKSRGKEVSQADDPLSSFSTQAAIQVGSTSHATYVLEGAIDTENKVQSLTMRLVSVADGAVHWSKAYPVAGADAARIAADVDANIPALRK